MSNQLNGMMTASIEKIRELVDVNTIIGDSITTPDGITIIPISKVSFGFVSGGSDIPSSSPKEVFAGGSGAGVTMKPEGFIVVKPSGDVTLLELGKDGNNVIEGIVTGVPELVTKIKNIFGKEETTEDK